MKKLNNIIISISSSLGSAMLGGLIISFPSRGGIHNLFLIIAIGLIILGGISPKD